MTGASPPPPGVPAVSTVTETMHCQGCGVLAKCHRPGNQCGCGSDNLLSSCRDEQLASSWAAAGQQQVAHCSSSRAEWCSSQAAVCSRGLAALVALRVCGSPPCLPCPAVLTAAHCCSLLLTAAHWCGVSGAGGAAGDGDPCGVPRRWCTAL
jgi:hypothetical protein